MAKTELVCPQCGAHIAIADHQHVTVGIVIGKDSNLGRVELPLEKEGKKKSKAQQRIDAMRAAGMDVSRFFCMKDGKGEETIVASQERDGSLSIIENDDPIINKIVEAGSLHNAHLFKQHVLAQMLKMLTSYHYDYSSQRFLLDRDYRGRVDMSNYGKCISNMSYGYSWEVLRDELKRQAAMYRHGDEKCLQEDGRWYNQALVLAMFEYHHNLLVKLTEELLLRRRHKGEPYVAIRFVEYLVPKKKSGIGYLYVSEIPAMLKAHKAFESSLRKAKDPIELYSALCKYMDEAHPQDLAVRSSDLKDGRAYGNIKVCPAWANAYKGYGGYFSMQNLIMFHGLRIILPNYVDGKVVKTKLSKDDSLKQLDKWADENLNEGYWLIGALKQLILDNNFNIEKKQAEWRARYRG